MAKEDENDNVTSLADAAKDAAGDPEQQTLDGTVLATVSFLGMSYEPAEAPPLKEYVEFVVRGRVTDHGEKVMKDGSVRPYAKVDVDGVIRVDEGTYAAHREEHKAAEG